VGGRTGGRGWAGGPGFGLTPVGLRPPSVSPKRNLAPPGEGWGSFDRYKGEFSTGIDNGGCRSISCAGELCLEPCDLTVRRPVGSPTPCSTACREAATSIIQSRVSALRCDDRHQDVVCKLFRNGDEGGLFVVPGPSGSSSTRAVVLMQPATTSTSRETQPLRGRLSGVYDVEERAVERNKRRRIRWRAP
jgi:hypothetical protein